MKQKNIVLMVVAVGCGLVAAFLTTQINAKPKLETVEVIVAAKNLPVGTMFSKAEVATLAIKKKVPKDSLPPQFVLTEDELLDKRLTRAMAKDEVFVPVALSKGGVVTLPDGKDMCALAVAAVDAAAGFVGPGSKIDVLARLQMDNTTEVFPLLIDMLVLAVNTHTSYEKSGVFPDVSMVSLAVTQEEALLLELAKQRGCHMSLLLRHDGKPLDPNYDMKKIKKLLETNKNPSIFVRSEAERGVANPPGVEPPVAPTQPVQPVQPVQPTTVKVLVAIDDIQPGTSLTSDLIKEKFAAKEFPKEVVEGVCLDLLQYANLGKALKFGVAKGQWVTNAMIGVENPKPSPHDDRVDNEPKGGPPEPKTEVAPNPPKVTPTPTPTPAPVAKKIWDVSVHTTSGTLVHRFQEVRPGEWKQIAVLSPEEAARTLKQPSGSSERQSSPPDAKKVD